LQNSNECVWEIMSIPPPYRIILCACALVYVYGEGRVMELFLKVPLDHVLRDDRRSVQRCMTAEWTWHYYESTLIVNIHDYHLCYPPGSYG
jgi:hypothetical protein